MTMRLISFMISYILIQFSRSKILLSRLINAISAIKYHLIRFFGLTLHSIISLSLSLCIFTSADSQIGSFPTPPGGLVWNKIVKKNDFTEETNYWQINKFNVMLLLNDGAIHELGIPRPSSYKIYWSIFANTLSLKT